MRDEVTSSTEHYQHILYGRLVKWSSRKISPTNAYESLCHALLASNAVLCQMSVNQSCRSVSEVFYQFQMPRIYDKAATSCLSSSSTGANNQLLTSPGTSAGLMT